MSGRDDDHLPDGKTARVPDSSAAVTDFLRTVQATPKRATGERGRLLFAMDATASRQPTWDRAAQLQGEMFRATSVLGGIDVQLAFFRGFGEFKVAKWTSDAKRMLELMSMVDCRAGETQIGKVLSHAANETRRRTIHALVYVGDSFEEDVDAIGKLAGELGLLGVPAFMFHEGSDPIAAFVYKEVARLTRGAYCPFDGASADSLRQLLGAVAVYAAGGRPALEDHARRAGGAALQITDQLDGKR